MAVVAVNQGGTADRSVYSSLAGIVFLLRTFLYLDILSCTEGMLWLLDSADGIVLVGKDDGCALLAEYAKGAFLRSGRNV